MDEPVKIESGETEVMVSPIGGTITSFRVGGKDILYPWQTVGEKARGGCFICAPWFGSSPRGPKKHGHLRDLKCKDLKVSSMQAAKANVVDLLFERPGDKDYPWFIRYKTKVFVRERHLIVFFNMERPMGDGCVEHAPILPAFHPYFACQDASKVGVSIGVMPSARRGFSPEPRAVPLQNDTIRIDMPGRRLGMAVDGFPLNTAQVVLWSDAPYRYACVEPVVGDKKLFDTPKGEHLYIGSSIDLSMSITVLE